MQIYHHVEQIDTQDAISITNLNPLIEEMIARSGITDGFVIVSSRHTTTAITINEHEPRLLEDLKTWLQKLAPAQDKYLHNDIHLRDCPADEPENAHSHLMAMLLGSSESIPLQQRKLALGKWQSVMLVDLDGPRERTVNIHIMGVGSE